MNRLDSAKRTAVLTALMEGCSIRSTVRMTGVAKKTVMRLLVEAGAVADAFQSRTLVNLPCKRIQVDELWSFCYAKAKNVTPEMAEGHPGAGSVWIWAAICADTKLVPSWCVGNRDEESGVAFLTDVARRMTGRIQLSSDAFPTYSKAVEEVFGTDVDYGQIIKIFKGGTVADARYSPAACVGARRVAVMGDPDMDHVSTSYVERQNLSLRMGVRRLTRLTNAFSRKIENHAAAVALYYFGYNFVRSHRSLGGITPAMAAGVTDRVWEVSDLVALLEKAESPKAA
ncbi:MAG: IS1 family transposase [Acidobacteriota bacterium]